MAGNTGVFLGNIRALESSRVLFGKWRKSLKFRADVSSGIFGFAVFERVLNSRLQSGQAIIAPKLGGGVCFNADFN